MNLIIVLTYLLGCVLTYGNVYAIFCNIDKPFVRWFKPNPLGDGDWVIILFLTILSFFGLFISTIMWAITKTDEANSYLKFSNKDLWKEYYKYNPKPNIVPGSNVVVNRPYR